MTEVSTEKDLGARALVLFSGGQDSTVCLAWALSRFGHVETIGFDYGQRHRVEMDCRAQIRENIVSKLSMEKLGVLGPDHVLSIPVLGEIGATALTSDVEITIGGNGLPTTFVPGRNLLFFTLAGALAYRRGINDLVAGVCETDYSGYPDCRDETVKAMQQALTLGMDKPCEIHTPLMWVDKAQTWNMAQDLGGTALVELIVKDTHTCYRGDRSELHDWGYGCGDCPACDLRAKGFAAFKKAG